MLWKCIKCEKMNLDSEEFCPVCDAKRYYSKEEIGDLVVVKDRFDRIERNIDRLTDAIKKLTAAHEGTDRKVDGLGSVKGLTAVRPQRSVMWGVVSVFAAAAVILFFMNMSMNAIQSSVEAKLASVELRPVKSSIQSSALARNKPVALKPAEELKPGENPKSVKSQPSVSAERFRDWRFIAYTNGTVLDTTTKLMWAGKDNGKDITLWDAETYCRNYQGGGHTDWRMPTMDELAGLYEKDKKFSPLIRPTLEHPAVYRITDFIDLSSCCLWGSDRDGSWSGWFTFLNGTRHAQSGSIYGHRALPVRQVN